MQLTKQVRHLKTKIKQQAGITLIESLIALLVLALGVLGLAGVQVRLLAESRTATNRAIAIGLIDDMTNRILFNRDAALAGSYVSAWGATVAAQDCSSNNCNSSQLAQSDLNIWRANVANALPGANATVFASANDARQIGIAIAWLVNEGAGQDSNSTAYNLPFLVTSALSGINCPASSICQVNYVQP
nr:type IV pilus modification protein PilV [uncultured Rhodoferax sp.]